MRNTFLLAGSLALLAIWSVGCAGPEQKLGRGLGNITEVARMGEFQRAEEQGGIFGGPDSGIFTGFVTGLNHTLAREGMGVYEVVTSPFPPYGPILVKYVNPKVVYPDSFQPRNFSDSAFDTDAYAGFSGGEVFPLSPGSHFRVFDN